MDEIQNNAPAEPGGEVDLLAFFDEPEVKGDSPAPQENNTEAEEQPEGDSDSGQVESDDDSDSAEGETEDSEESDEDPEYEITVNGKKERVKQSELLQGYQRQADYTRKTSELAQKTKEFEAHMEETNRQYAAKLQEINHNLQMFDPVPRLMQELQKAHEIGDIEAVNKLRLDIRDAHEARRYYDEQLKTAEAELQKAESQRDAEHIAKQRDVLFEKFPFLKDEKRKDSFNKTMNSAFEKVGFTNEELSGLKPREKDARVAALAYYAGLYLKSQDARPQVAEAIKGKVITPKPGARPADAKGAKRESAFRNFAANPNEEGSLAAVLDSINF
jgi:hypothetical protein